ncbi:MAG: extracellular solute-binding protein [Nitrospirae bacterium]|nr:MAG: extracellular solute-binding protein [Nitrospirota bacterium]
MCKKTAIYVISVFIFAVFAIHASAAFEIICASTTSTENSGLLGHILPAFEKKTGIKVKVVARGTGAAIEMGKRGDADVVLVHAKELELKALEEGWFVSRHDVMYNDFIIIGPKDDPSKIKRSKTVIEVFKKIAADNALFVSRGDKSGTHIKELDIWKKAGINPKDQKWYLEVGQGMEKTQRIANEKRAYTIGDRGTWLAVKDRDKLDMELVFEGDPPLFNQYGVMAVNPLKHKHVKHKEALEFVNWIISKEGQQAIKSFKDSHGNQLFYPNAK